MDELEFALENIDGGTFEDFAMAFLRADGYDVHESGGSGADGGWDARVRIGGNEGIVHASTQRRWKRKLRTDAKKVESLEETRGADYDLLVFVTNQDIQGAQELAMEAEIEDEYGWRLKIIHRKNILGELRQNKQDLAEEFLDIDLKRDRDHLHEIEDFRDDRLDEIQSRSGCASDLEDGSVIVLHIIPNAIFSKDKVRSADDIPTPSVVFDRLASHPETRGKYKITYGRRGRTESQSAYGILRNDGLYESVTASAVVEGRNGELWIQGGIRSSGIGLDPAVVLATRDTLSDLSEMGFSGTAFVSLSFLGARNVKIDTDHNRGQMFAQSAQELGSERYSTEVYSLPIGEDEIIEDIEPVLSEVWRQFGFQEGTPNIEGGKWGRGNIRVNGEMLLEEGDL